MSEPLARHQLFEYDEAQPFVIINIPAFTPDTELLHSHWHEELEIAYIRMGNSHHYIDGQCVVAEPGRLIVTNSGSVHSIIPGGTTREQSDEIAAVVLLIHPLCGLPSILLCVLVIALTRYISLGSMTMLLTYMVLIWIVCFGQWALCIFATILFIMCVYRHRANIQRLLNGTENKIGRRVQPQTTEKK